MTISFVPFALPIKTSLLLYIRRVVPVRKCNLFEGDLLDVP